MCTWWKRPYVGTFHFKIFIDMGLYQPHYKKNSVHQNNADLKLIKTRNTPNDSFPDLRVYVVPLKNTKMMDMSNLELCSSWWETEGAMWFCVDSHEWRHWTALVTSFYVHISYISFIVVIHLCQRKHIPICNTFPSAANQTNPHSCICILGGTWWFRATHFCPCQIAKNNCGADIKWNYFLIMICSMNMT